ncbi:pyridoxal phosphate-dependent aminotransferase [Bacillus sp. FJAT-44742]|uniref:pyridoxal phosphate-dependent aminotransferase n=1 Tax=Bacillus sp. FJAT-44742 TaxID=2014005 RepID=UPI000C23A2D6|nr:aminotransferase class I/II-fold pyridoxal phosphate-dependent enzyme [Bacillus sp. FJAT-44742]
MHWPEHGAMPNELARRLGTSVPQDILDFSVNTNPFGPPDSFRKLWPSWMEAAFYYPHPQGEDVRKAVAEAAGVRKEEVLAGNGGSEIIFLLARLYKDKTVLLIEPSFAEYRTALEANEARIKTIMAQEENQWQPSLHDFLGALSSVDAVFFSHPNNPTGVSYGEELLSKMFQACHDRDIDIVCDEAFYDFTVNHRHLLSWRHSFPTLIIIRSMTKMFSIPGLRAGYLIASPDKVRQAEKLMPAWSVNNIAGCAIKQAFKEQSFTDASVNMIATERERVKTNLEEMGFVISPSTVNYYLLREDPTKDLLPLITFLSEKGIHVRHTYNFSGLNGSYIRMAVKKKEENDRLLAVMQWWKER